MRRRTPTVSPSAIEMLQLQAWLVLVPLCI